MSDNKNIERFFQEKFKDIDVNPEPVAWDNIAMKLNKKKSKKRIFPFWMTFGGIAASLIIGYFLFNNFSSNNGIQNNPTIVNSEKQTEINKNSSKINNTDEKSTIVVTKDNHNDSLIVNKNNEINKKSPILNNNDSSKIVTLSNKNNPVSNQNNSVVTLSNKNKTDKNNLISNQNDNESKVGVITNKKTNKKSPNINNNSKSEIATSSNKNKTDKNNLISNQNDDESKVAVSINNTTNKKSPFLNNNSKSEIAVSSVENKSDKNSNRNNFISNNIIEEKLNSNVNKVAINKIEDKTNEINLSEKLNSNIENNSNPKNQEKQIIAEEVIKKPDLLENPLDKILKEKVAKTTKKAIASNTEKWKIRPNVAPIFMKAFGGSPIHDVFADNEKDFENNLSIGLAADYAISKKFSIRAGINKFDLAYNTNEIAFYEDASAGNNNPIQTINFKAATRNVVVDDKKSGRGIVGPIIPNIEEGIMNQRFGYFEIPVEVSYKLLDKRFGVTLITGLSTLLLNKNEVSVVTSTRTLVLGDANNLNQVHFSSNLGIGFKYSFWKSFEANVEPTVKYQINTFNDNSGNFNPYFLGIYTGISYKL